MKPRVGVLLMISVKANPEYAYIEETVRDWITKAGATIVPILPTITAVEAAAYFEHIHGLFLLQGWADQPEYTALIRLFLNMATLANRAGDYFPVWGTCQGFQRFIQHFGGTLDKLNSTHFSEGARFIMQTPRKKSRMFKSVSLTTITHLQHQYIPYFNHQYGITLYNFMKIQGLRDTFRVLSTSHDRDGKEYVSLIEGRVLPFYGVQFHPDKPNSGLDWMATFFVNEMRKSRHTGFLPEEVILHAGLCEQEMGYNTACLRIEL